MSQFGPPVDERLAFQQLLAQRTPRVFVTHGLIAINVLVFGVMLVAGVSPISPEIEDLLRFGADFGPYTSTVSGGASSPRCSSTEASSTSASTCTRCGTR